MPNIFNNTPETSIKAEDMLISAIKSSSRHLPVQSQQWEHQSNVWNLFKVNNKDTRTIITDFGQISHIVLVFPLLTLNN